MSSGFSGFFQALEITDINGTKSGKFQLILRDEENNVISLCNHKHDTAMGALRCSEADSIPWGVPPFTFKHLAEIALKISKQPRITIDPANSATQIAADPSE